MLQAAANCAGTQLQILSGNYAGKKKGIWIFPFFQAFTMPENIETYNMEITVLQGNGVWGGGCEFIWRFLNAATSAEAWPNLTAEAGGASGEFWLLNSH